MEVCGDVVDENGEALGSEAELRWGARVGADVEDHEPGVAEIELRAADGVTVAVVLGESEYAGEPDDCIGNVLINDVREHSICRDGAIV